jgi:hypothetical protein
MPARPSPSRPPTGRHHRALIAISLVIAAAFAHRRSARPRPTGVRCPPRQDAAAIFSDEQEAAGARIADRAPPGRRAEPLTVVVAGLALATLLGAVALFTWRVAALPRRPTHADVAAANVRERELRFRIPIAPAQQQSTVILRVTSVDGGRATMTVQCSLVLSEAVVRGLVDARTGRPAVDVRGSWVRLRSKYAGAAWTIRAEGSAPAAPITHATTASSSPSSSASSSSG